FSSRKLCDLRQMLDLTVPPIAALHRRRHDRTTIQFAALNMSPPGPVPSSVYITTCRQLAKLPGERLTKGRVLTRSGRPGECRVVSAAATTWPAVATALTLGRGMAPRCAVA